MTTKQEMLQELFHRYQREHGELPAGTYQVVQWAMGKGLIEAPRVDPIAILAEDMRRALREEYAVDPLTGRRYRRNHAIRITQRGVQLSLWADIATAPREHMRKAFQQRRKQIVGDCIQLKVDVDVYNSHHPEMDQLPLVLDFTDDVAEFEAADEVA